jgi:myo-inositol-1(or 4)-monophosphatase
MTDWLEECRGAARDLRVVFEGLPARADREAILRAGVGGDDTTAIDDAAERVVVERLERLHAAGESFTLVSEELGERRFGDGDSRWVVVDPVDGSVNAKRGIPFFSLSVAVAEGPTMGDVWFGYVYDFGSGEEWTAVRGEGARLNGEALAPELPKDEIEILSFEATKTVSIAERVGAMVGLAERLRIMGSLAITLCHLAAGRVDAVCSLKGARSVDIAAAQLLVRECGLAIDLPEAPPFEAAPLDLEGRSRVVAAAAPEVCERLFQALTMGPQSGSTSASL